MNNPSNILITKENVEDILNHFGNIGDNNTRLQINDLRHYQKAFVHESYFQSVQNYIVNITDKKEKSNENDKIFINYIPDESYERLEYLGDSILKAIQGKYLYERFGSDREGVLTKLKIKIEQCTMLHKIAVILGFKKFLLLSLQVENQTILDIYRGRGCASIYEDSYEAFIGAISLDFGEKGYIYADRFVRNSIENIIDFGELISTNDNFKDSLQRYFQSLKWENPNYLSLDENGPLYRKVFTKIVLILKDKIENETIKNNLECYTKKIINNYKMTNPDIFKQLFELYTNNNQYILGIGNGRTKKISEQQSAKESMINLKLDLNY